MQTKREVEDSLGKLEVLKPRIEKRYKRYAQALEERRAQHAKPPAAVEGSTTSPGTAYERQDPALAGRERPLAASENKDLAVKLAQKELRRRATSKDTPAAAGSASQIHRSEDVWGTPNQRIRIDEGTELQDDLSSRLQAMRSRVSESRRKPAESSRLADAARSGPAEGQKTVGSIPVDQQQPLPGYHYPLVPIHNEPMHNDFENQQIPPPPVPIKEPHSPPTILPPPLPPRVPAKLSNDTPIPTDSSSPEPHPPPLPSKIPPLPTTPGSDERSGTPSSDLNPSVFTFKPSSYLENGTPLRTIFISPDLRKQFLAIASQNTRLNLETCGILCGTLISNAFFISKLLIPEQESTSDTCEMINEASIFEFCDRLDLMVLGWIHTHPTQTCFMSSRDLHTHSGYQAMLAESIAIVCAPSKQPDWGVFRLTDPPGLKTVLACGQTGLFHPHAEPDVYTDALRPGHVFEAKGLEFETVDLRLGKGR